MNGLYEEAIANVGGYRDVQPAQVAKAHDGVRIVDVREPHEYSGELGHIAAAELVPLGTVESAAKAWDKDQELVLVCRSGARSGRAASMLSSVGFARVMNMTGGMLAWNEARLPVAR